LSKILYIIDIDNAVDINDGPRDDQTEIENNFEVVDHITNNIISSIANVGGDETF
jgi:hypothetical protein